MLVSSLTIISIECLVSAMLLLLLLLPSCEESGVHPYPLLLQLLLMIMMLLLMVMVEIWAVNEDNNNYNH